MLVSDAHSLSIFYFPKANEPKFIVCTAAQAVAQATFVAESLHVVLLPKPVFDYLQWCERQ